MGGYNRRWHGRTGVCAVASQQEGCEFDSCLYCIWMSCQSQLPLTVQRHRHQAHLFRLRMLVCLWVWPCVKLAMFPCGSHLDEEGRPFPLSPVTSSNHVTSDTTSAWQFPRPPSFRRWKAEGEHRATKSSLTFFLLFHKQIFNVFFFFNISSLTIEWSFSEVVLGTTDATVRWLLQRWA